MKCIICKTNEVPICPVQGHILLNEEEESEKEEINRFNEKHHTNLTYDHLNVSDDGYESLFGYDLTDFEILKKRYYSWVGLPIN